MKTKWKKIVAFTLAEIMIVFGVIAVVSASTIGIQKSKNGYVDKYMYYGAFKSVEDLVTAMMSEGTDTKLTVNSQVASTVNHPITTSQAVTTTNTVNQPKTVSVPSTVSVNHPIQVNHPYQVNQPITTPTNVNTPVLVNQPITTTTSTNVNNPVSVNHPISTTVSVNHPITTTVSVNHPITTTVSVNHPITTTVSVNHPVLVNHPVSVNHPITTNVTTRTTYTDQQIFSYLSAHESTLKFLPPDSGTTSYASNPATNSTTLISYGSYGSSLLQPGQLMTDVAGDVTRALKAALPTMDSAKFNAAISAATTATNTFYTYSEAHPLAVTSPLNGKNQTQINHTNTRYRDLSQMVKTFLVEFDKAAGATGADLGTDSPGVTTRAVVSGSDAGGAFNVTAPVTTDNWVLEDNWVLTDNWVNETTTTDHWVDETTTTDNWVNETVTTDHWVDETTVTDNWVMEDRWSVVTTTSTVDNWVYVDNWTIVNIVTDNWVWLDNWVWQDNWVNETVYNNVLVDNYVDVTSTSYKDVTVDNYVTTYETKTANSTIHTKALPASGTALCNSLVEKINTAGSAVDCSLTGTLSPNFTMSNGMRWFNLGSDPVYIGPTGYTQDQKDVDYSNQIYTIYIDIDGASKGTNTVNSDIMPFYINRDGSLILPAPDSPGANNITYLSSNIRYNNGTSYILPLEGVPYREALCKARKVPSTIQSAYGYCVGIVPDTTATTCNGQDCEVVINKPGL